MITVGELEVVSVKARDGGVSIEFAPGVEEAQVAELMKVPVYVSVDEIQAAPGGIELKRLIVAEDGTVTADGCYPGTFPESTKKGLELEAQVSYRVATVKSVDDVGKKADEAKEIASQAGTDPQLQALATLQISTMSFAEIPSDEVVKFIDYWPEWKPDTSYKHNDPITYQCRKFRASKDLTSQAIYPPGTAESEYYEVTLAPDGIIVWYNVGGAYNMVHKGERRHYPDADGSVYEALEDTTYSPDAYP